MKMKKRLIHGSFLIQITILLICIFTISPVLTVIHSDPPVSGDWIVTDTTTINNQIILMNGSIVITGSGSLTLTNTTIIFQGNTDAVPNGKYNLTVEENGELVVESDSTITTDSPTYRTYIWLNGSSAAISDTTLSNMGINSAYTGITIYGGDILIDNCDIEVIATSYAAIRSYDTDDITITNNHILAYNAFGIYLYNSDNCFIQNNNISVITEGFAIGLRTCDNSIIDNNKVFIGGAYGAISLFGYCSDISITGNDVVSNCSYSGANLWIKAEDITYGHENIYVANNNFQAPYSTAWNVWIGDGGLIEANPKNITLLNNEMMCPNGLGVQVDVIEDFEVIDNTIIAAKYGILNRDQADGNLTISNNIIDSGKYFGISVYGTYTYATAEQSPLIYHNTLTNSEQEGMNFTNCPYTKVIDNTISNTGDDGLFMKGCPYSEISGNTITNVNMSFASPNGIYLRDSNHTTLTGNVVSNVGFMGFYLYDSHHLVVDGNTFQNLVYDGILIVYSSDFVINNSIIKYANRYGIMVNFCPNDFIIENNFIENTNRGIYVTSSDYGTIRRNTITQATYGILSTSTSNNVVYEENLITKTNYGLHIQGDACEVYNNSIINNFYGIYLDSSSQDNSVFYNDIIGNSVQAIDIGISNEWSAQVGSVYFGNFWSDYEGIDVVAPFGHGDIPYNISGNANAQDEYPLTSPGMVGPPSISNPADQVITTGIIGHSLAWIGTSLIPYEYSIKINGVLAISSSWDGSAIVFSLNGLSTGNYTIECTIYDILGQSISDEVFIEVQTPDTGEPAGSSGEFDLPSGMIGAAIGAVAMVAIFVLISLIRRRK